jgi:WhiB family redox-sensing transcriptional regulator
VSAGWSAAAACRGQDPDLFHPDDDAGVARAKAVCRRCPVADACLQDALANGIQAGILGGLTEIERASLQRATRRHRLTAQAVMARAADFRQPQPPKPRTLQEHAARHTVRIFGGHLDWAGPKRPWVAGKSWTPLQLVFAADRGREPEGRVKAGCSRVGCVKPSHITDEAERRHAAAPIAA